MGIGGNRRQLVATGGNWWESVGTGGNWWELVGTGGGLGKIVHAPQGQELRIRQVGVFHYDLRSMTYNLL